MQITGHGEKSSNHYDAIYGNGYNTAPYTPLYNEVLKMLSGINNPRILEIGCGVGDMAKIVLGKKLPYRGFDFSEEAISQCRRLCPDGNFKIGNAYDDGSYWPFDYNIVIALEVLEHLDDYRIIEKIPAGAEIIASVPNYEDDAHLRLYKNPRTDIVDHFAPYIKVKEIRALSETDPDFAPQKIIYLFRGLRIIPA